MVADQEDAILAMVDQMDADRTVVAQRDALKDGRWKGHVKE